jgi:hypothetical protein
MRNSRIHNKRPRPITFQKDAVPWLNSHVQQWIFLASGKLELSSRIKGMVPIFTISVILKDESATYELMYGFPHQVGTSAGALNAEETSKLALAVKPSVSCFKPRILTRNSSSRLAEAAHEAETSNNIPQTQAPILPSLRITCLSAL